jgi:hypothetical protein
MTALGYIGAGRADILSPEASLPSRVPKGIGMKWKLMMDITTHFQQQEHLPSLGFHPCSHLQVQNLLKL